MFEKQTNITELIRSPLNIASAALDELQSRLGGKKVVSDPNSPFCFLLEFGSSLAALTANAMDEKFPALYPRRSMSMEDLYHHMSDYDYLKMYSSPAQTTFRLMLPKKYLFDNGISVNTNYRQVTIPKDTIFTLGRYVFGMYYPINIQMNNFTGTFTVVYDTSIVNPLFTLTSNVVSKYEFTYKGLEYIVLDFPIYQFAKSVIEESIITETGFNKKLSYNDNFYAIRIFSYSNGTYTELRQSQSYLVYDSTVPTALVRVLPDEKNVYINIPQTYFDQGKMGSKLYMEIYTTLGAMDVDTVGIDPSLISINFGQRSKDTTQYSAIFKNIPFDGIGKIQGTKITGGSNPVDIATLRNRVVNDALYEKAPITEAEIAVYFEDQGFYVKKYKDNVTDRIYHAYRVLEDSSGSIIPSITLPMMAIASYVNTCPTFKLQTDNSITILPNSIFKYVTETDSAIPLTIEEFQRFSEFSKQELADELNSDQYLKTPFHIRLDLSDRYYNAVSFNLMTPKVRKVLFEGENYSVSAKMIAADFLIYHLERGTGGYEVSLSVSKSDDLKNIPESAISIYIAAKTVSGYWVGTECTHFADSDVRSIYKFKIETNYQLSLNNEISVTNFTSETNDLREHMISLDTDFHIVFFINKAALTGTYEDASYQITNGVPAEFMRDKVALSRQYISVHLGHSLSDVIKNEMEISSTAKQYLTWDHDVPLLYTEDVYERDSNGNLVVEIVDGKVQLNKVHSMGEQVLDDIGLPVYKHRVGELRYDPSGQPIEIVARERVYYVTTMFIDAKVFASERSAETNFYNNLQSTLEGYFDAVRNLQSQLIERTHIYFRCVRSTGQANFNFGDGYITKQNIEMSFKINCYVPAYVKKDISIQDIIKEKTCEAVEQAIKTKTISMSEIFESVRSKMSDYIDHFTLLGTDGVISNQTFKILNEDAQPSISRKLVLSEDNVLSLVKDIDITFLVLDDETVE